ncbi:MAG: glycoside hydrolase family 5 protein [Patescibacteria group bacterium]
MWSSDNTQFGFAFIPLLVFTIAIVFVLYVSRDYVNRQTSPLSSYTSREELTKPIKSDYNLSFLKVSGKNITDGSEKIVYLRGFQGLGFYPIPSDLYMAAINKKGISFASLDSAAKDLNQYTITEYDINEIKSTGANVVRVWFVLHEIEKEPYKYSKEALDLLETTINEFGDAGIYTILVLGKVGQNSYPPSNPYLNQGISFWENTDNIQDRTVKLWGILAERLQNNPNVAAYDVINEPVAPSKDALRSYYEDAITEIRKYDLNHILILETDNLHKTEYQLGGKYEDTNLVGSFHFYFPHDFTLSSGTEYMIDGLEYPGGTFCAHANRPGCEKITWTKNTLEEILIQALAAEDFQDIPVFVGEFGANSVRDDTGALKWVEDTFSLLNKYNLHYTYHNYRLPNTHGYYFVQNPEKQKKIERVVKEISSGNIKFSEITEEQKELLKTENSYKLRPGIKEIVTKGFKNQL